MAEKVRFFKVSQATQTQERGGYHDNAPTIVTKKSDRQGATFNGYFDRSLLVCLPNNNIEKIVQ